MGGTNGRPTSAHAQPPTPGEPAHASASDGAGGSSDDDGEGVGEVEGLEDAAQSRVGRRRPPPLWSADGVDVATQCVYAEVWPALRLSRRSERDAHVGYFWEVMEALEHEERRAFLRFTWGRSRLPLDHASFEQQFKIQSFGRSPADRYYPVAHTCFFSLELPAYSSRAVMRERLRYAIHNCEAIDGDQTGVGNTAAALGFDVEVDDEED